MKKTFNHLVLLFLHSAFFLLPFVAPAATNDLTRALQQGLFEEEANRDLDAAISAYQSLVGAFDKDRKIAATAVFRLGEIYRKQGKTNEAVAQYERIAREFADQTTLVTLSRQNLAGLGVPAAQAQRSGQPHLAELQAELRRKESLLANLKALSAEELMQVLPTSVSDPTLNELLSKLHLAQQNLAMLNQEFATEHPNSIKARKLIETISRQISDRAAGIVESIKVQVDISKAQLEALSKQSTTALVGTPSILNDAEEQQQIRSIQVMIQNSPDLINASRAGVDSGRTPLERAASEGWLRVATFLLDHGANPDVRNKDGETPLIVAASQGHSAMVELLLSRAADVNAKMPNGETALHLAATHGFQAVAESLLSSKADVDARNNNGQTPLHAAVFNGHSGLVRLLLANKASTEVGAENFNGVTPLTLASQRGHLLSVKALLSAGANLKFHDQKGRTALSYAAENAHSDIVNALLEAKADPNLADVAGWTALKYAAHRGHSEIVKRLLEAKADSNVVDKTGRTPLSFAADGGHTEVVKQLLAADANPNAGTADSPLLLAVRADNAELVEMLLRAGSDPNQITDCLAPRPPSTHLPSSIPWRERAKRTPLQVAVLEKHPEMATLLLRFKGDAKAKDPDGNPLVLRTLDNPELLKAFLEAGADPNANDGKGRYALIMAATSGNPQAVELLLEHDADANIHGQYDMTALHWASSTGNGEVAEALLKGGADPNVRLSGGNTPLHFAVINGQSEIVQMLLANGANPNVRNSDESRTPLDYTKSNSRLSGEIAKNPSKWREMADLLHQHGAVDDLPWMDRIEVSRPSAGYLAPAFVRSTNDWNQFMLSEVIAWQYGFLSNNVSGNWKVFDKVTDANFWGGNHCQFPDLSRIVIRRATADEKGWTTQRVDVARLLDSDSSRGSFVLKWGDVVEIPERDHPVTERWYGEMNPPITNILGKVSRSLAISIKGTNASLEFGPEYEFHPNIFGSMGRTTVTATRASFMLRSVLDQSKLLRASSDLTKVRVTRREPNGKAISWVLDCSDPQTAPDLWLRDGDVIEVPEK